MYKRSNIILVIAIMCFSFSCKSESKDKLPTSPSVEKMEKVSEAPSPTKDAMEEKEVLKETEIKEAIEPKDVKEVVAEKTSTPPPPPAPKVVKKSDPVVNTQDKNIEEPKTQLEPKAESKTSNTTNNDDSNPSPSKEIVKEVKEVVNPAPPKVDPPKETTKPEKGTTDILELNHKAFDALLRTHVIGSGKVNYSGFKKDISKLDAYLAELESSDISLLSRNEKLAYWINAYNAYTIKLIVDNYPVSSITDLHGGKPWDHKWINLGGKSLSLNNIENDIIRPTFKEPRIHFAVNCAAKSCPPLLNAAYTANALNNQLESQTKKFINNTKFNTLSKNEITVSNIFKWYQVDFGDIASYIMRYADTTVKPSAKVSYNEYDWALNN